MRLPSTSSRAGGSRWPRRRRRAAVDNRRPPEPWSRVSLRAVATAWPVRPARATRPAQAQPGPRSKRRPRLSERPGYPARGTEGKDRLGGPARRGLAVSPPEGPSRSRAETHPTQSQPLDALQIRPRITFHANTENHVPGGRTVSTLSVSTLHPHRQSRHRGRHRPAGSKLLIGSPLIQRPAAALMAAGRQALGRPFVDRAALTPGGRRSRS